MYRSPYGYWQGYYRQGHRNRYYGGMQKQAMDLSDPAVAAALGAGVGGLGGLGATALSGKKKKRGGDYLRNALLGAALGGGAGGGAAYLAGQFGRGQAAPPAPPMPVPAPVPGGGSEDGGPGWGMWGAGAAGLGAAALAASLLRRWLLRRGGGGFGGMLPGPGYGGRPALLRPNPRLPSGGAGASMLHTPSSQGLTRLSDLSKEQLVGLFNMLRAGR